MRAMNADREWAKIFEQDAVVRLLSHGVHTLRGTKYVDPVVDPVLTVWSIGAEKLLKLSLGFLRESRSQPWPSHGEMRTEYGHQIAKMDEYLRTELRSWVAQRQSAYLRSLTDRVDDNSVWPHLRTAIDIYGRAGRFHHLDTLAGKRSSDQNPRQAWQSAELAASEELSNLDAGDGGDAELSIAALDQFAKDVNALIAQSVVDWWFMITRAAMHGFLGEEGKRFGSATGPSMAIPVLTPSDP